MRNREKFFGEILIRERVRNGGSRREVLGGYCEFLTGNMEDRFIPYVMNDFFTLRSIP